jgi:hypothetical protein
MPRGRQYYDPELQVNKLVEGEKDLARIELFPVGQDSTARLPEEHGKWVARKVEADGSVSGYTPGDFDHDRAQTQAEQIWPGLQVFEIRSEIEDSTWEGTGPSPRLWQNAIGEVAPAVGPTILPEGEEILYPPQDDQGQVQLRVLPISEPGAYVLLSDIKSLMEMWASQYEEDKNPSAAMALRDVVDALKDAG